MLDSIGSGLNTTHHDDTIDFNLNNFKQPDTSGTGQTPIYISKSSVLVDYANINERQITSDIQQRPEVYSHSYFFDSEFYATQNPDLARAGITSEAGLKNHWLSHGIHEGRQGSANFNSKWYMGRYPDLGINGIKTPEDAIGHFADHGRFESRKTSSLTSDVTLSQDLKMDIYQPVNLEEKKVPVVINLVGGGWASAEKDHPAMQTMGKDFAKNGIAMISPEYHTAPSHTYPAQMHDIDSVLKYVKDHAEENNWDLDNITLAGGSAGGHLALQHAMNPMFNKNPELPEVKNVIAIAPATDLTNAEEDSSKNKISDFLGTEDMIVQDEASPSTYAKLPSDKRFYISYGLLDTTTRPEKQAVPFIKKMKKSGQDILPDIHLNGKHGDWLVPNEEQYDPNFISRMSQWIKKA